MKTVRIIIFIALILTLGLSACQPQSVADVVGESGRVVIGKGEEELDGGILAPDSFPGLRESPVDSDLNLQTTNTGEILAQIPTTYNLAASINRMVIKHAAIKLLVESTDTAINRLTQVAGDTGGYIISSQVWFRDIGKESYKYATYTLGVPVDQFENALQRLRELSIKVIDESASGEDVTEQYVNLKSQVDNLTATRDRIRTFLDKATTVEEALRVNAQLASVEGEIAQVQGRMNYLSDRSAFSTITINLEPEIAEITPTEPQGWTIGAIVQNALGTLGSIYQGVAGLVIWFGLVAVPVAVPVLIMIWLGRRVWLKTTRKFLPQ